MRLRIRNYRRAKGRHHSYVVGQLGEVLDDAAESLVRCEDLLRVHEDIVSGEFTADGSACDLARLSKPSNRLEQAAYRAASWQAGRRTRQSLSSLDKVLRQRVIVAVDGIHAYHRQQPSDTPWSSLPVQDAQTLTEGHRAKAAACFDAFSNTDLNGRAIIQDPASLIRALDSVFGHMLHGVNSVVSRTLDLLGPSYASYLISCRPLMSSVVIEDFIRLCMAYQQRGLAAILVHFQLDELSFAIVSLDNWARPEASEISEGQLWCLEQVFGRFALPIEGDGMQVQSCRERCVGPDGMGRDGTGRDGLAPEESLFSLSTFFGRP